MKQNRCLLSYEDLTDGNYKPESLKKLHRGLSQLKVFPSHQEQLKAAQRLASKLSIQGVQLKLSARLNVKQESFEVCERGGTYIVKPQSKDYSHLPENEDLTMKLAALAQIEVPWHGLVRCEDGSCSYFIRRFDRVARNKKLALEDFGQLIGATRTTKYLASMERLAEVIEQFCTYPTVEWRKFFRRIVFSYLVGNEDLHVKNFSLITRKDKVELSPAYDLLNSTLALAAPEEEMALELRGKKKGFTREDFELFARENLYLPEKIIQAEINKLIALQPEWEQWVDKSFLTLEEQKEYKEILRQRISCLS